MSSYEKTLGPPNAPLSNKNEWCYGNRGDLVVCVQGKNQGSFHNKITGEAGGMLDLLMRSMSLPIKDALSYGAQMIKQLPPIETISKQTQQPNLSNQDMIRNREIV